MILWKTLIVLIFELNLENIILISQNWNVVKSSFLGLFNAQLLIEFFFNGIKLFSEQ